MASTNTQQLTRLPVNAAFQAVPAVARNADFDTRWDAWVERGRVHERHVRRKFAIWSGVLSIGAAIVYAILKS
jgi:hypothetical protein